ncbi:unnamed protein product [Rotaria socialis]|uniref:Tetratricopeptide repeat protein n=1 Tax=Rotaria socialis TaxID=392032 RepID=A0A818HXM5_9BILA|nr:unnamed protein product [Rotaria socialis]CAF4805094.1 unnamed protein product [Rotaria socialis]
MDPTNTKPAPAHQIPESICSCKSESVRTNEITSGESSVIRNMSLQSSWSNAIDDFIIIWLDANMDEANCDYQQSITKLRCIVDSIKLFRNEDDCNDFLQRVNKQKFSLILSENCGENLIPKLLHSSQLDSIYILSTDTIISEHLLKQSRKINGVFPDISAICNQIKQNTQQYKYENMPISIVSTSCPNNLKELDPSFMYTQLIKQVLLEIEYGDQSKQELINFLCTRNSGNINSIRTFDRDYYNETPIWWYTKESFIYSMLNTALRTQDNETIIKMGFIVRDVHRQIEQVYLKTDRQIKRIVYRGQCISHAELEKIQRSHGGLFSFNNFLSTSTDRQVAYLFADSARSHSELVPVIFQIEIDPSISSTVFAPLDGISYFSDQEAEILFSMHTVCRIENTYRIDDRLWNIDLTLTDDNDEQLKCLTNYMQQEIEELPVSHRLGHLMIKMGEFDRAEQFFYGIINATSGKDLDKIAYLYHQLGFVKYSQGHNSTALEHFEKSREIRENTPSLIDLKVAKTYSAIGTVYANMANYSAALSYYEKSIAIKEKFLSPIDPDWAITYNNMGQFYYMTGDYSSARLYFEKAIEIPEKSLPPIHPSRATAYNNLGATLKLLEDYSTSLLYYEKALEIEQKSLLPNHASLAITYNNIAGIHNLNGDYTSALSYLEKTLDIQQHSLPSTHYNLAKTYNNIGTTHLSMGNHSIALSSQEKALEIQQNSLSSTDPSIGATYYNIGKTYQSIGNYSNALVYFQTALEIQEKSLPINYPILGTRYNAIAETYHSMENYSTALSYYEKTLEIQKQFPEYSHSKFDVTCKKIADILHRLGRHQEAARYDEKQPIDVPSQAVEYNQSN